MKRKINRSKICCFVLGTAGALIILWMAVVVIQSAPFSDTKNFDVYTTDQSVRQLQNKYNQVVDKFSSLISSFNKDKQVKYAIVSPDNTSDSEQELEDEYNKLLRMDAVEFYNYLNNLYETDVNYHIENLPYFEDEVIKENEVGSAGSQSEFEFLK